MSPDPFNPISNPQPNFQSHNVRERAPNLRGIREETTKHIPPSPPHNVQRATAVLEGLEKSQQLERHFIPQCRVKCNGFDVKEVTITLKDLLKSLQCYLIDKHKMIQPSRVKDCA